MSIAHRKFRIYMTHLLALIWLVAAAGSMASK
jgi:hypothetical protein